MQFDVCLASPRTGGVAFAYTAPGVQDNANAECQLPSPASPKPFSVTSLRVVNSARHARRNESHDALKESVRKEKSEKR
jgi:hypothetical protein